MLVHRHDGRLKCIPQAHHALISGVLAGAWRGLCEPRDDLLHPLLVQATGLHDDAWRDFDAAPSWNPATGRPYDFIDLPMDRKVPLYRAGLDRLEALHPYVAYLVSLHYTAFSGTRDVEALVVPEAARRERLLQQLPPLFEDVDRGDVDLAYLQLFDTLSLYLCLTRPGTAANTTPSWLATPTWSRDPACGRPIDLIWHDPQTLGCDPFPFGDQLRVDLLYRSLPDQSWPDEAAWQAAWQQAPWATETIAVMGQRE